MHPWTVIVVAIVSAIGVLGHPGAADTAPAVHFWEAALPGTPMPEVIADLVQQGIAHSPLVEHYPVTDDGTLDFTLHYRPPPATANEIRAPASSRKNKINYSQNRGPKIAMSFFREAQVRVGSTMSLSFPLALVPPILPRDVAEGVPFSDPASVLATFHIAPSSAEAAMVRATVNQCQELPVDPEQKACTTSLEGTVQSAMHMLGKYDNQALWAAAPALPSIGLPLQSYMIKAVTPLDGDRHVGCHIMPYPYAVYYCHMTGLPTKAYMVSVRSVNGGGPAVTLAVLCHLDTSDWDPAHPAFKMLRTQPGGVPVCHFISYANLLFGEKAVAGNP